MKFFKPTLVAVALVALIGCNQETKAPVLETETQKQAYSLGASIGMFMERNLEEHTKLGLTLDKALISQGFLDSLAGKSVINTEDVKALLTSLDQTMKAKQQEMVVKQAEEGIALGLKFLEDNAKRPGIEVTASGVQYEVITAADGEKPMATDTVVVHYVGTLINGEKFDSSVDRGQPITLSLNRVIRGWTEGVQLMSVGSKYKFTIPSDLAYGPNGRPPTIPGNAVLQFEIELLEIKKPEPIAAIEEMPKVEQVKVTAVPKLEGIEEQAAAATEEVATAEVATAEVAEKEAVAKEVTDQPSEQ